MARKDDILNIYTKEVEGIKEAGLFKGEAPFVSPQGARVTMEDGRELLCGRSGHFRNYHTSF